MKVFLSWSGDRSREIATALHDWIPYVIQSAKPFISAGDIDKGRRWNEVLGNELSESAYGIICITRDNANEPWLHFEAGAISKAIDNSFVSPFLFDIEPERVPGPLQQFQSTVYREHDLFALIRSINGCAPPDLQVAPEILKSEFDAWWPKLRDQLDKIATTDTHTNTGYDWLYATDDLVVRLKHYECKSVWWITPDPYAYALTKLKELIQAQLQRGVTLTFVVAASEEADIAVQGLSRLGTGKPGVVHICDIPKDLFRKAVATDYVIVDPESSSAGVFLELPAATRGFWIRVDDQAAALFVGRFTELQRMAARSVSPT